MSTKIGFTENEIKESIKKLFDKEQGLSLHSPHNLHFPLLYKYYNLKKQTIDNFENDILYMASPASFNDPYDCSPAIDMQEIYDDIKTTDQPDLHFHKTFQWPNTMHNSKMISKKISIILLLQMRMADLLFQYSVW